MNSNYTHILQVFNVRKGTHVVEETQGLTREDFQRWWAGLAYEYNGPAKTITIHSDEQHTWYIVHRDTVRVEVHPAAMMKEVIQDLLSKELYEIASGKGFDPNRR